MKMIFLLYLRTAWKAQPQQIQELAILFVLLFIRGYLRDSYNFSSLQIEELLATDVEVEEAIERRFVPRRRTLSTNLIQIRRANRSYAISCLENFTHSLLHQLVEAMEDEDAHGRPCGHIELQLADRKSKSEDNVRSVLRAALSMLFSHPSSLKRCGMKTMVFPSRRRHNTSHLGLLHIPRCRNASLAS